MDVGRLGVSGLVNFEETYSGPMGLTYLARSLDRRHLADLEWPIWQEVAEDLQQRLSDSAIDAAVCALPPPYDARGGPALAARLKARRQALPAFAHRFYEMLTREAEVHATDEADSARLHYLADGSVEVVLAGPRGPYFRRTFRASETKEVRVLLKGGDDRVISEGRAGRGVKVHVAGGDGNDLLDDSAAGRTRFYDSSGENQIVKGPGTKTSPRPYTSPTDPEGEPARDWGAELGGRPWMRLDSDQGLLLGASIQRTGYGFRKYPYADRHSLQGGYATNIGAGAGQYEYRSLRTDGRGRLDLLVRVSALDFIHFYGLGNETKEGETQGFNDVRQTQYVLAPSYRLELAPLDVWVGPIVKYADTHSSPFSLISLERPYGATGFGQAGARLGILFDRRDHQAAPSKGLRLSAEGAFYPSLWSDDSRPARHLRSG
jgi:hypothetical protein